MKSSLYNRDILRLAASLQDQRLQQPDSSVERSSPVCGSRVTIDISTGADGRVSEIGQEVHACALGQASTALMAAHAVGRTAHEIRQARDQLRDYLGGNRTDPGGWPGLAVFSDARLFPARHGSIMLAFEAAAEALERAEAAQGD